jgi:hypothetical protein
MISSDNRFFGIQPAYLLKGSRVALVGNSPGILASDHGAEIDSHDEVIRFNGAMVSGYERSTGSKTTAVCVAIDIAYIYADPYKLPWMLSKDNIDNEESIFLARCHNAEQLLRLFPCSAFFVFEPKLGMRWTCAADHLLPVSDQPGLSPTFYYFDEQPDSYIDSFEYANVFLERLNISGRLKFGGPRTGFKMVIRCILSGVTPSLYGFDTDSRISTAEHYYDNVTKEDVGSYADHDIRSERDIIAEMASLGLVKVVAG